MLRSRLTFLYATLMGGVLLLFGMAVYGLVNVRLTRQIDALLEDTARDILKVASIDSVGEVKVLSLPELDMSTNVFVQLWDRQGRLRSSSSDILQLNASLDPSGLQVSTPEFHSVYFQDIHLRVFNLPLSVGDRPVGMLQLATSLTVVDSVREDLLYILTLAAVLAMVIAALSSWLAIERALAPLETVVKTTRQISRADDLSRRIPYHNLPNDEIGLLVTTFNDTLERLENIFASQQRFLADVSHELRTPLTVIKGNVGLMRRMDSVDEETLTSIDEEADRLTRLVGDLLLLAQAETGNLPLQETCVELDALLLEVMQQMHVLAGEKVKLQLTEIDQIQVSGDRDRLKQVLVNLIGNAIQYTPPGGDVSIRLGKNTDRYTELTIRDTGPGIPAEDLPHIFDRFYRAEKARTRSKTGGFGLGLSIAYWIVHKHGGEIAVDSKEGEGTTFTIRLPLLTERG